MEPSHEYCDAVRWALSLIPMMAANDKLFLSNSCRRYTVNINGMIRRSIFRRTRLASSELGSKETWFCPSKTRALSLLAIWALTPCIRSPVSAIPISLDWQSVSRASHQASRYVLVLPCPLHMLYRRTCWVQTFSTPSSELPHEFHSMLSCQAIFIIPQAVCRPHLLLSNILVLLEISHNDYRRRLKRAIEVSFWAVHFRKFKIWSNQRNIAEIGSDKTGAWIGW